MFDDIRGLVDGLVERGYAVLHQRRLVPTERGPVLAAFLEHGFGQWMDYGFTAAMEDDFDRIAAGGLGRDPDTGMAITLRRGPTGWYVQRGEREGKAKPARMSLPPSLEPEEVDLAMALRLLALRRRIGLHPETGAPVLAGIGRYGPWVRHEEVYAAIPDDDDVLTVGINRAVALIADKHDGADLPRHGRQRRRPAHGGAAGA